jgi:hypothetical protein
MTWPCKSLLWTAALALLAGCVSAPLPPPPPPLVPQQLASPLLSAADVRRAEQHAYWAGYAAGRRYQTQQDAQNTPDAPSPASVPDAALPQITVPPVTDTSTAPLAVTAIPAAAAPPAVAPLQPMPPPVDSYSPKGPAQPVATPVN